MGTFRGVAVAVAAGFLLAGCLTGEPLKKRNEFIEKNKQGTYACQLRIICGGYYKDIAKAEKANEPLPDCNRLGDSFPITGDLKVLILSFEEYYPHVHLGAALLEPLDFHVTVDDPASGKRKTVFVRVPVGYITDFASVPTGLPQAIHRTFSKTDIPSIAHDFLYDLGRAPCDGTQNQPSACAGGDAAKREYMQTRDLDRLRADRVIEAGMKANYSRVASYGTVYLAVRTFGNSGFGNPTGLRFLDLKREAKSRVVVPSAEFDRSKGYPAALYDQYVRVCDAA